MLNCPSPFFILYEDLSNSPKPTKKAETESEKVEKITEKLFEELNQLEKPKKFTTLNK